MDTQDGIAKFRGVSSRECTVQVTATGYATVRETVMVMGSSGENDAYIKLQPNSDSQTAANGGAAAGGKSRRELDLAIAALHADLTAEAKPHIEYALKHAPANPDVHYIAAIYFLSLKDSDTARQHLESAVGIFPEHFSAQITLGELVVGTARCRCRDPAPGKGPFARRKFLAWPLAAGGGPLAASRQCRQS